MPDMEIWKSRFPNLTWTHIFRSLRVGDDTAIRWYLQMASQEMWSVRTLDRNISTQYFERSPFTRFVKWINMLIRETDGSLSFKLNFQVRLR